MRQLTAAWVTAHTRALLPWGPRHAPHSVDFWGNQASGGLRSPTVLGEPCRLTVTTRHADLGDLSSDARQAYQGISCRHGSPPLREQHVCICFSGEQFSFLSGEQRLWSRQTWI